VSLGHVRTLSILTLLHPWLALLRQMDAENERYPQISELVRRMRPQLGVYNKELQCTRGRVYSIAIVH
jgi:hypothetical protein